jgi:hypothetical protein
MVIVMRSEERFEGRISGLGGLTMGRSLVGLMVVWLRGLDLGIGLELGIEVGYHHFLVAGDGVVDRNGLGLPNLVLGEFGHIHLGIDWIDSIVESHEASGSVGPDISVYLI